MRPGPCPAIAAGDCLDAGCATASNEGILRGCKAKRRGAAYEVRRVCVDGPGFLESLLVRAVNTSRSVIYSCIQVRRTRRSLPRMITSGMRSRKLLRVIVAQVGLHPVGMRGLGELPALYVSITDTTVVTDKARISCGRTYTLLDWLVWSSMTKSRFSTALSRRRERLIARCNASTTISLALSTASARGRTADCLRKDGRLR